MKKKSLSFLLYCTVLSGVLGILSGCARESAREEGPDLMEHISAKEIPPEADLSGPGAAALTDLGVRLLQNASGEENENTLFSPLSIVCALGMVENGAKGETLAQMEETLGMPREEMAAYLYHFVHALPESDRYRLRAADSVWLRDDGGLTVERDFLQANADYYGADVYKEPFDSLSVERINGWVNENTDGMIQEILTEIPADAVMYLANALAFEAEWEMIYTEDQVRAGTFTGADGTEQPADLMYSEEYGYLRDEHASGFVKYYADERYAFAALLPEEGVSVRDYVASLTGERLRDLLQNVEDTVVYAAIPRYTCAYDVQMKEVLQTMGMRDVFDPDRADLSGIGSYPAEPLYMSEVAHKAFIAVDERGTRAGAVTVAEIAAKGAAPEGETVYLDRPFVYMLIECGTDVPVFIGTVETVGE